MPRKERLPKNVTSYVDRHGKVRYRFRKTGYEPGTFRAHPNSVEGKEELRGFLRGRPVDVERYSKGTVGWVAARYYVSAAFTGQKNQDTQRNAKRILEHFVSKFAKDQLAGFRFDHIEAILTKAAKTRVIGGRQYGGPSASDNLRGEMKPFFDYGFKLLGIEKPNPVDQAAEISVPKGGFHSWDEAEIAQFRTYYQLGTKARLALEIFLWTWQRRGDAVLFGRKHMRDGKIAYTQSKTGKTLWLPAAPQLIAAIDAMQVVGTETFLVTDYGKPYSKAGFGNWFADRCREAGLPDRCRAHGLRKAGARRAAQLKASNQMLKAVGGWVNDQEVSLYTAAVEQADLAELTLASVIAFDADLANRGGTECEG